MYIIWMCQLLAMLFAKWLKLYDINLLMTSTKNEIFYIVFYYMKERFLFS